MIGQRVRRGFGRNIYSARKPGYMSSMRTVYGALGKLSLTGVRIMDGYRILK
jgi:hypothetical protein